MAGKELEGFERLHKVRLWLIVLRELGIKSVLNLGIYKIGLLSGHYFRVTRDTEYEDEAISTDGASYVPRQILDIPSHETLLRIFTSDKENDLESRLIDEAEEVLNGRMRIFGGELAPIFSPAASELRHWTEYERGKAAAEIDDIKFIWEPARLGWAFTLGRAYGIRQDDLTLSERYARAFWDNLKEFLDSNPPYLGQNWISSQEAALRVIAMAFGWQVFSSSPHSTPERARLLAGAIAAHAKRIPPTLVYARAQNNNHLLSEAVGLYTAGVILPGHPSANIWRKQGWQVFHQGLKEQIDEDGAYIQHSTNYQRLMLQLGLWMRLVAKVQGDDFPEVSLKLLASATRWLRTLVDELSGRAPNLGPNDGALILPLSSSHFEDYRPVIQSASRAFLGKRWLEFGPWDEMSVWLVGNDLDAIFDYEGQRQAVLERAPLHKTPHRLDSPAGDSWAYLRAVRFSNRPGHADQLHLDLWRGGENIACDAGTYRYNGPPPWDNALTGGEVHNTVTIDGKDQMQKAGRFLYVKRAQSKVSAIFVNEVGDIQLSADHDGYRRYGVILRRTVKAMSDGSWLIEDTALPAKQAETTEHLVCLNWLLQDCSWEVEAYGNIAVIRLNMPDRPIELILTSPFNLTQKGSGSIQIIRAGEMVYGSGEVKPTWGWVSPTYGIKIPALAVRLSGYSRLPLILMSEWRFR